MAALGSIENKFQRTYVCVNPDVTTGPQTWRLAVPLDIGLPGGGAVGTTYDFEGESPIVVTQEPALSPNKEDVTTTFDISQLDDRAA